MSTQEREKRALLIENELTLGSEVRDLLEYQGFEVLWIIGIMEVGEDGISCACLSYQETFEDLLEWRTDPFDLALLCGDLPGGLHQSRHDIPHPASYIRRLLTENPRIIFTNIDSLANAQMAELAGLTRYYSSTRKSSLLDFMRDLGRILEQMGFLAVGA